MTNRFRWFCFGAAMGLAMAIVIITPNPAAQAILALVGCGAIGTAAWLDIRARP